MDFTSRMAALLGAFRRERNGAVADSMRFYGAPCGLNYGVSLPTLRTLARAEAADHDFAKYLWRQDVRCLRLAALHIADPARLTPGEFAFWGDGLLNSEIAAEAAFALLSRIGAFPEPSCTGPLRPASRKRTCWLMAPWRCSRPSGRETKRTGRRFSVRPALWVSSLPKTASTRSWPGDWRFRAASPVRAFRVRSAR